MAEKALVPLFILVVCAMAFVYCGAQIANILADTFEAVEQVIPEAEVAKEVEQTYVEVMPIVTQEALPAVEQALEEVMESVNAIDVNTITPGSTWAELSLPPVDISKSHADKHAEYMQVRHCYEDPGNVVMYRQPHKSASFDFMFHILCLSKDDGKWYDRIIYRIKGVWYEETAFRPQDGSWQQVQRWLNSKGVNRIRTLP